MKHDLYKFRFLNNPPPYSRRSCATKFKLLSFLFVSSVFLLNVFRFTVIINICMNVSTQNVTSDIIILYYILYNVFEFSGNFSIHIISEIALGFTSIQWL
jgi:hypothetical protein